MCGHSHNDFRCPRNMIRGEGGILIISEEEKDIIRCYIKFVLLIIVIIRQNKV